MKLCVLGGGGHAKVVIATARSIGYAQISVYDDDPARRGEVLCGAPIVGAVDEVLDRADELAVIAVGDNATRHRLMSRARCELATLVHARACVDASATLGPGTVVFAGAVIQPDARLGAGVIVNTSCSIDHDCVIGDAAHLAPGSHLAGTVTVGAGAFLGIGAVVVPGRRIGAWTRVGAGAVVVRDVDDGATVVGVPARSR
ncbi:MAG: acetyltransferase [Deltaproteobacteria bacterium]|nr:acetyltransferase [Deltaproteobacteria bacterium]